MRRAARLTVLGLALVLAAPAWGCRRRDKATPDGVLHQNRGVDVGGASRVYHFYEPVDPGTDPLPVVVSLHGHGQQIDNVAGVSGRAAPPRQWQFVADREKFLVAYLQGLEGSDNQTGWNDCRGDATKLTDSDDVAFVRAVIDEEDRDSAIDRSRIYVTGVSNGGMMSLRMALEADDLVAAVGAVIASMPASSECVTPTNSMSVLFMNGTDDGLVPYDGGEIPGNGSGSVLGTVESAEFWQNHNGAQPPTTTGMPSLDNNDGSTVDRIEYAGGADGSEVVIYRVNGGGHVEPSIAEPYSSVVEVALDDQNHDIEMAEEIWSFFADKTR